MVDSFVIVLTFAFDTLFFAYRSNRTTEHRTKAPILPLPLSLVSSMTLVVAVVRFFPSGGPISGLWLRGAQSLGNVLGHLSYLFHLEFGSVFSFLALALALVRAELARSVIFPRFSLSVFGLFVA